MLKRSLKLFCLLVFIAGSIWGQEAKSQTYALLCAVEKYDNVFINDLPGTKTDVENFAYFLKGEYGGNVPAGNIKFLIDKEATTENVKKEIKDFLGRAGANDRVYLYFSMHGGDGEILTYRNNWREFYLKMNELPALIRENIRAREVILIVDTCGSGVCADVFKNDNVRRPNQKIAVFSACYPDKNARSLLFSLGGLFSIWFYQGLQGWADDNGDGKVTIREMLSFLRGMMKLTSLGAQLQYCHIDEGMEDAVLSEGDYDLPW